MSWYWVVLLCWLFFQFGFINATVGERERYFTWMANSWELMNRRLWWINMATKDPTEATLVDIAELNHNLFRTVHDFNGVFGRPYLKEELLPVEPRVGDFEMTGVDDGSE